MEVCRELIPFQLKGAQITPMYIMEMNWLVIAKCRHLPQIVVYTYR